MKLSQTWIFPRRCFYLINAWVPWLWRSYPQRPILGSIRVQWLIALIVGVGKNADRKNMQVTFSLNNKTRTSSETRQREKRRKTHLSTTPEPVEGRKFFSGHKRERWKRFSINHRNSINRKVAGDYFFALYTDKLLTALSPKFRTLQWSFADCPTVAITSRFVALSKNGNPYCVSHTGCASPLIISVADEWKTVRDKKFNNSTKRRRCDCLPNKDKRHRDESRIFPVWCERSGF